MINSGLQSSPLTIRRADRDRDGEAIWRIFRAVVAGGDTYVFAPNTPREDALGFFFDPAVHCFVAEAEGRVVGMYKWTTNRRDLGSHVANASFMVDSSSGGRGVGRALGQHALEEARRAGHLAMQFNFVVSTNLRAVRLWKSLGFSIVGTLPKAFRHSQLGLVDAYVMYRYL